MEPDGGSGGEYKRADYMGRLESGGGLSGENQLTPATHGREESRGGKPRKEEGLSSVYLEER
jgi:hypothetical protein